LACRIDCPHAADQSGLRSHQCRQPDRYVAAESILTDSFKKSGGVAALTASDRNVESRADLSRDPSGSLSGQTGVNQNCAERDDSDAERHAICAFERDNIGKADELTPDRQQEHALNQRPPRKDRNHDGERAGP